jgi:hypothetical protein
MNSNIFSEHNDIHQTFAPKIFHSLAKLKIYITKKKKRCNYRKKNVNDRGFNNP